MDFQRLLPSETFCVKLSEIEVRMTLQELCGSKWYGYPFEGHVYENSFSLRKNHFANRRNLNGITLEGYFYEENGKTAISIYPNFKLQDLAAYLLFAIGSGGILCYGISEMFISLIMRGGEGFFVPFLATVGGGILLGIIHSTLIGGFEKSIETLKEAFRAAQRSKET